MYAVLTPGVVRVEPSRNGTQQRSLTKKFRMDLDIIHPNHRNKWLNLQRYPDREIEVLTVSHWNRRHFMDLEYKLRANRHDDFTIKKVYYNSAQGTGFMTIRGPVASIKNIIEKNWEFDSVQIEKMSSF
jgi:hypothetical protein